MATTSSSPGTRWLSETDGPSSEWADEHLSAHLTGDHPAPAQAPSWLGTSHSVSYTQDGCLLARSASAESSAHRCAAQTGWSDASLSIPSRPDTAASSPTQQPTSGMADGCSRNPAGRGGRSGESDQHCRCYQSPQG